MTRIIWMAMALALTTVAEAASFDCSKVTTKVGKLICGNEELSWLDTGLNYSYQALLAQSKEVHSIVNDEKRWLKLTRNVCQDVDCLVKVYRDRIDVFEGKIQESTVPPKAIPGVNDDDKLGFLSTLTSDSNPFTNNYFELALNDQNARIRKEGARFVYGEFRIVTPLLLKVMASDPDDAVRLSAALNLNCRYLCNGVDYSSGDAMALASNLPLLERAIRDEVAGRYVVEILDTVWCDLTDESRRSISSVLASDLPYGKDSVGINDLAKGLIAEHSSNPCH